MYAFSEYVHVYGESLYCRHKEYDATPEQTNEIRLRGS